MPTISKPTLKTTPIATPKPTPKPAPRKPAKTLMEFALDELLGDRRGNYWHCPRCERRNPSICFRPVGPNNNKPRFGCARCGDDCRGDLHDLLEKALGIARPDTRYEVIGRLKVEYAAKYPDAAETAHFSPSGMGCTNPADRDIDPADRADRLRRVTALLKPAQKTAMIRLHGLTKLYDLAADEIVAAIRREADRLNRADRLHCESCKDDACLDVACRVVRARLAQMAADPFGDDDLTDHLPGDLAELDAQRWWAAGW